jgi:hypothetical protein
VAVKKAYLIPAADLNLLRFEIEVASGAYSIELRSPAKSLHVPALRRSTPMDNALKNFNVSRFTDIARIPDCRTIKMLI